MNVKAYATLKKAEFPTGAKCSVPNCPNTILPGKPYDEYVEKVEGSQVTVYIICVYH